MHTIKQEYNIINRVKSFVIGGLMGLTSLVGCHKPENPTPPTPQPDPTDTIIIPTKEKVFDVDWNEGIGIAPSADSIKKYTDNPEYKYVFINFVNKTFSSTAGQDGMQCSGYVVRNFKRARDTLQTRIDINPKKVCGSGKIILESMGEASLPDDASQLTPGMTKRDSAWYAQNGWGFGYLRNFSK